MTLSLIEESTGERQLISYSDADVVLDGMVDSIWIGAESWRALSGEDFDLSLVDFPSSVREWKGKFRWLSKSDLHGTLSVCENGLFFYHQKIPFPTSDAECIEKWLKDLPERQADKEALSVPAYIGIIDVNLFRQFRESTPKEPSE